MQRFILLLLVSSWGASSQARANTGPVTDTFRTSTVQQAIVYLDSVDHLDSSAYWPNADPVLFMQNLKLFVVHPLQFYEGKSTNFCAYSAFTYIPLRYDPLGFARFMVTLYTTGAAKLGRVNFRPSEAVKQEAGLLKYKGILDISPASQIWFLSLADHFKGYLNLFNRHFDKGDENRMWAATNFAKFNRMLRKLFLFRVHARGSDLIRPWVSDLYTYLHKKIQTGVVFLFLNNKLLYKKMHVTAKFGIPTHYVLLLDIYKTSNNKINIVYWDYGRKTLQQLDPQLLHKIVFGISHCLIKKR